MQARLFIRDDDAVTLDREFRFFFDAAIERGIPVIYAVIPGKMDQGLIRFLGRAKEKTPHLLDIVQHGWMHKNYAVPGAAKYEFGPLRSLKQQREDIAQGLEKMQQAFGSHFTSAFVPPYHGYDARTLKVLDEEGFKVFSAGHRRVGSKRKFLELAAKVSFTSYDQGRKDIREAKDVIGELAQGIMRQPLSGVVMHHADFKTSASRRELKKFFDCIKALKAREGWRVLLFSDMLSASKRG